MGAGSGRAVRRAAAGALRETLNSFAEIGLGYLSLDRAVRHAEWILVGWRHIYESGSSRQGLDYQPIAIDRHPGHPHSERDEQPSWR
jgi:hypothetical protein